MFSKKQTHGREQAEVRSVVSRPQARERATRAAQGHPSQIVQRAALDKPSLTQGGVLQLQRAFGNRAVGRWLQGGAAAHGAVQLKSSVSDVSEGQAADAPLSAPVQRRENRTGLPDGLKAGMENLSGVSLDDVAVHYNSERPAQMRALAYTQGTSIYISPGQEQHLAHETWHVVQQKQGRVQATLQMQGEAVNDSPALEREADVMGERVRAGVARMGEGASTPDAAPPDVLAANSPTPVIQGYDMTYGPLVNDCGSDMHVLIYGKNDPDISKGGVPSVVPNWWPTAFNEPDGPTRTYFSNYVVQGHLLNNNIGGPGNTMSNLTPITKSTNTTHLTNIEKAVKTEVLDNNMWVEYRVRADYSSHPAAVDFGMGVPAGVSKYLNKMAGTIGADYDVYDPVTKNKVRGMVGEKLIKNEGAHLKGTF